ncbi:MAG: XdhC family protein [Actinomycetota bacterium]|nr:XdhC family protein [Actinomycetota bacterium]
MHELADALARLDREGPVGRAVVLATWGSAPRMPGSMLLAGAKGGIAGSVSGGCVESAVIEEIAAARIRGTSKRVRYEVSDETAWSVGLACGGVVEVLVQGEVPPEVRGATSEVRGVVVVTALEDGRRWSVLESGEIVGEDGLPASVATLALQALSGGRSELQSTSDLGPRTSHLFFEVFPRPSELCIVGAGHVAQELVPLARRLGFRTLLFDARAAFLTRERFPDADELIPGWPADELAKRIGSSTYVCVLSHDPKLDEPCVRLALRSPAKYVGVIGSKKNQEKRRAKLADEGYSPDEIPRLHGPIGLPLGGNRPDEIALSILAELVGIRARRGSPLPG